MDFLNKWIIGFKPIMYTPIWNWYRLINHRDYRLDDRHYQEHQNYCKFISRHYKDKINEI